LIENKITDDILERDAETIQRLRKIYKWFLNLICNKYYCIINLLEVI